MVVRCSCCSIRRSPVPQGSPEEGEIGASPPWRSSPDRGQAVPLLAAALALMAVLALGVVRLAAVAADRARAHTAADAAALAGVAEGRTAAQDVARANGATVVTFEQVGGQVEVRVRVRDVEAVARAELRR